MVCEIVERNQSAQADSQHELAESEWNALELSPVIVSDDSIPFMCTNSFNYHVLLCYKNKRGNFT